MHSLAGTVNATLRDNAAQLHAVSEDTAALHRLALNVSADQVIAGSSSSRPCISEWLCNSNTRLCQ